MEESIAFSNIVAKPQTAESRDRCGRRLSVHLPEITMDSFCARGKCAVTVGVVVQVVSIGDRILPHAGYLGTIVVVEDNQVVFGQGDSEASLGRTVDLRLRCLDRGRLRRRD